MLNSTTTRDSTHWLARQTVRTGACTRIAKQRTMHVHLQKGLRDLLHPPPEHTVGHEASPVSYLQATVLKLICHCPAECCCRRPPASCPSKTARKDKYLLHIDNIEQVSLRPSKTWYAPGRLKEYLTKVLNSEQARAEQLFSRFVQTKKRHFE